jgi:uncharacterized protein (TIRG00374 family)
MKTLWRIARIALAVLPIIWIYTRADTDALGKAITSASMPIVVAILALAVINIALQGVKWWVLIRRFAPELKLGKAVAVHFEGTFYAIVLPSVAALDVVKSAMLSRSHDPSVVWAATWLSRLLGFFSLMVFSAVGCIYLGGSGVLPAGFGVAFAAIVVAMIVFFALSFSKRLTRPIRVVAAKIISPKIMGKIERLREGIYAFKYARKTLALTLFISAVANIIAIFGISLAVYVVSGKLYFIECLAFVPLVEIMVVSLPLTPGGVGLREALMALLFTQINFSSEQIALYATMSLLMSMTRVAGGVLPAYRMIARRK